MKSFAELCESITAASRKKVKVSLVADFLRLQEIPVAAVAARFLSGKVLPGSLETNLQVGGSLLSRAVIELCGDEQKLYTAYKRFGDLGSAAAEVLPLFQGVAHSDLTLLQVEAVFAEIAQVSAADAKLGLIVGLLSRVSSLEAKFIIKIVSGDLRIGLRESLVEEAIAQAYSVELLQVRRANMLLRDISEVLLRAAENRLAEVQNHLRLFHPVGMMLASPIENVQEAAPLLATSVIEDKYDGIRAQIHFDGEVVQIFSRTLENITSAFPDLAAALLTFDEPVVLDGEIVAWDRSNAGKGGEGRAAPFANLQKRIGRKVVSRNLMTDVPVALIVFDLLYVNGELLIDRTLEERVNRLKELFFHREARLSGEGVPLSADGSGISERGVGERSGQHSLHIISPVPKTGSAVWKFQEQGGDDAAPLILQAPTRRCANAAELDAAFAEAQGRGNEGLMIKDLNSVYALGHRGRAWLKLKRELATLDVVVTAVEYGHGKRASVLSDYTFAVRQNQSFLNIGKAYSGLTDAEIAELTQWFAQHVIVDRGLLLVVEPKIVLEVAFNNVMKSPRHESGYALRFPRILKIRNDKKAEDIDTLERVEQIYASQHGLRKTVLEDSVSQGYGNVSRTPSGIDGDLIQEQER